MEEWRGLWFLNLIILPAIGVAVLLLVIKILKSIYNQKFGKTGNLAEDVKQHMVVIAVCIGAAVISIVGFKIISSMVSDNSSRGTEQYCASVAGYVTPADDSSSRATTETKAVYRQCLENR